MRSACWAIDNQLRASTATGGLINFKYDSEGPVWADSNWRCWPLLTISSDFGPDVFCGVNAILHNFDISFQDLRAADMKRTRRGHRVLQAKVNQVEEQTIIVIQ